MGTENDMCSLNRLIGELCQFIFNHTGKCFNVVCVILPCANNRSFGHYKAVASGDFVHAIEAGTGGRNRELWIQRQHNKSSNAVIFNLFKSLLSERMPVAHRYINMCTNAASA